MLQEKAFMAIFLLDYPGLYTLLEIANRDFDKISLFILNRLAQTDEIKEIIIIPSLLNDLTGNSSNRRKISSLAALNRMYSSVSEAGALPLLLKLLQEGFLDRYLITSTIRACGQNGEDILLKVSKFLN